MNAVAKIGDMDVEGVLELYPPTLPVELALRTSTPKAICEAYGLTRADLEHLLTVEAFRVDLRKAQDMVRREGMSFRLKARLQAEELLRTSWKLIHDTNMPPAVRADLLKFTVRAAGLDGSKDQGAADKAPPLNIQINLG